MPVKRFRPGSDGIPEQGMLAVGAAPPKTGPKKLNTLFFARLCQEYDVPRPVTEHQFWPGRKFAFDFAWVPQKIALEVEGGVFTRGRHTRPMGFLKDCEKYNEAALRGWCLLRVPFQDYLDRDTVLMVKRAFQERA